MSRIDRLIAAMTLAEKLGQMTMSDGGLCGDRAGHAADLRSRHHARAQIGNVLNLYGADKVRAIQRLAVEETRLRIPLLLGLDVIHGHRTIFPIPLGETAAVRSRALGSDRARGGEGRRRRRRAHDLRADAGCGARSALGPDRRRPGRRSLCRPGDGAGQSDEAFKARVWPTPTRWRACAKHYCAYGAVMAGREYAATDVSQRALREVYLPPFAGGGGGRRRHHHAGLHRSGRRADDARIARC